MNEPLYRKGDEVEIVRRGVIVEVDPKDPARFGIGRPDGFGADAYFRTDDDKVRHRLVTVAEPTADTTEHPDACTRCRRVVEHLHVFESRPGVQFCADCAVGVLVPNGAETATEGGAS